MGGRDVIAHIKDALASAHPGAVDDEVTEYVADMANELLAEGDLGRSPAEMAEELVDAAGPMLAEFIDDDAIKSLFDDAVAHHLGGGGSAAGDGSCGRGRPTGEEAILPRPRRDHTRVRGQGPAPAHVVEARARETVRDGGSERRG